MVKLPSFRYRVTPWRHQGLALMQSWDREAFALYMEQGTGKTKVIIDNAGLLWLHDKIEALVIVAPDGVQRGWLRDQMPKHASADLPYVSALYTNTPNKTQQRALEALYDPRFKGLRVIAVSYDTLATAKAQKEMRRFLNTFRCMMIADESHKIKSVDAARTKAMLKLGPYAAYRRILTGTPVGVSPLDVYSQFLFLDETILGGLSWVTFRAHYSVIEDEDSDLMRHVMRRLVAKYGEEIAKKRRPQMVARDPTTGRPMYRNVEELSELLKPHSIRVLKADCLDLPPKVYQRRYVYLTATQRAMYEQLKENFLLEYDMRTMSAPLVITRLMRLSQITGGFFVPGEAFDGDDAEIPIGGGNPKLDSLLDAVEQASGKILIWARFTAELRMIADALEERYGAYSVCRYWGERSKRQRDTSKQRFENDPRCRYFVGQPKAGGTGLDGLQVANTEIYFSNEDSLIDRLQSEDRAHRGGSEVHESVTIIDIEAEDTLDAKIINSLINKKELADVVTGDHPRNWL